MGEIISKPRVAPFVSEVETLKDYKLQLNFENGEERILDMKPYMIGVFTELKNTAYFKKVEVVDGSIAWPDGQDLAYDMLYHESKPVTVKK